MSASESERLRLADGETADAFSRLEEPGPTGALSVVVQTKTVTTYPTTAATFYGVTRGTVLGTETEGSSGTVSTAGGTFYALNLGSSIPPVGTSVVVTFVRSRWVFRYG